MKRADLPERVRDNMRAANARPCGFCGTRSAKVGDLCALCDEDNEAREQYAAFCAREHETLEPGGLW